jgi:hypothetical protein
MPTLPSLPAHLIEIKTRLQATDKTPEYRVSGQNKSCYDQVKDCSVVF